MTISGQIRRPIRSKTSQATSKRWATISSGLGFTVNDERRSGRCNARTRETQLWRPFRFWLSQQSVRSDKSVDGFGAATDLPAGVGRQRLFDFGKDRRWIEVVIQRRDTEAAGLLSRKRRRRRGAYEDFSLRFLGEQWRRRYTAQTAPLGNRRRPQF